MVCKKSSVQGTTKRSVLKGRHKRMHASEIPPLTWHVGKFQVKVPRVAEAAVTLECRLRHKYEIKNRSAFCMGLNGFD